MLGKGGISVSQTSIFQVNISQGVEEKFQKFGQKARAVKVCQTRQKSNRMGGGGKCHDHKVISEMRRGRDTPSRCPHIHCHPRSMMKTE